MKKLIVFLFVVGCTTVAFGQDNRAIAKKIANATQDPSKACTTDDGRSGTLKVTSRETTTSTTYGNSDTKNSVGSTYGGGIGTSGINVNYNRTTGTESNTQNETTTTTTKTVEKCFPNRW